MIASTFSKWGYADFGEYFAGSVMPTCVYTALVSIPVFRWLMKAYEIGGTEEYL